MCVYIKIIKLHLSDVKFLTLYEHNEEKNGKAVSVSVRCVHDIALSSYRDDGEEWMLRCVFNLMAFLSLSLSLLILLRFSLARPSADEDLLSMEQTNAYQFSSLCHFLSSVSCINLLNITVYSLRAQIILLRH